MEKSEKGKLPKTNFAPIKRMDNPNIKETEKREKYIDTFFSNEWISIYFNLK